MWMKQIPFPKRACGIIAVCVFDAWNTDRPALSAWSVCGGEGGGGHWSQWREGVGGWVGVRVGGGGCPLSVDVAIRGNSCHAEIYQRGWKADSPRRKGVTPSSPTPPPPPPPPGPPPCLCWNCCPRDLLLIWHGLLMMVSPGEQITHWLCGRKWLRGEWGGVGGVRWLTFFL